MVRSFLALVVVLLAAAPALALGYTVDVDGTLYSIDCARPGARKIGVVRDRGGPPLVLTDLGTTPGGAVYGVSKTSLYKIDLRDPGASTRVGDHGLSGPYGFCIGPDGVGYANTNDGGFYTIDLGTAKPTLVGAMGGGFVASGDLAFCGRKRLLSSVKDANGVETLVRIDPKTGAATRIDAIRDAEGAGVPDVFGLLWEDGHLYGLCASGTVVEIDPTTARTRLVDIMTIRFWGATDAEIEE